MKRPPPPPLLAPWAVALLFAAVDACEQLRVPSASVEHALVHVHTFDGLYDQAKQLTALWGMPAYKTQDMSLQLLDAMEDMARHDASEALVNFTLDRTLSYEVSDGATADRPPMSQVIKLRPEEPVETTVVAFCERMNLTTCEYLHTQIRALAARDWGCLDENSTQTTEAAPATTEHSVMATNEADSIQRPPSPTQTDALDGAASPALPTIPVVADDTLHEVTVQTDTDLELQAALLCRQWRPHDSECAALMDLFSNVTKHHPAFANPPVVPISTADGLALRLTSPVAGRLNPTSERVYFDGEWFDPSTGSAFAGRHTVCLYFNYGNSPQFCGPFPPTEIWYVEPFSFSDGYQFMLLAEPSDPSTGVGAAAEPTFIAARHFWIVTPTITLHDVRLHRVGTQFCLMLEVHTTAFDPSDPAFRVCALVDGDLVCFKGSKLNVVSQFGTNKNLHVMLEAPLFGVRSGPHKAKLLLMDVFNKCLAHSLTVEFTVDLLPTAELSAYDPSFYTERAVEAQARRPAVCPAAMAASSLAWICDLWQHEWGRYSQNGEDGVLQSIFDHVEATNRFYVEFGTEDARQCNTRYLKDELQWTGLLMDGRYANATINLHREWISPENINELFAKYDVPREFDLLSVDVDFNDYWILDAVDRSRFSPRVVVIEVNSHIPPDEARVVKYNGPTAMWDGRTSYFGVSVGAMQVWSRKNGYSLVYCESHGVNCFLVRDDVLAMVAHDDGDDFDVSDVLQAADVYAPPNFFGRGMKYPLPTADSGVVEDWVWLGEQ